MNKYNTVKRGATGSLWGGFTTTTIVVVVEFYYENVVLCICDKNTISHTIAQSLRWMSTEPSQSQPIQVEWEPENTTTNNLKRHYISLRCTALLHKIVCVKINLFHVYYTYVCVCACTYLQAHSKSMRKCKFCKIFTDSTSTLCAVRCGVLHANMWNWCVGVAFYFTFFWHFFRKFLIFIFIFIFLAGFLSAVIQFARFHYAALLLA